MSNQGSKAMRAIVALAVSIVTASALAQGIDYLPAGIRLGMAYSKAKQRLLDDGWQVLQDDKPGAPYKDYPEIDCGEGADAVCSAGFQKGSNYVAVLVAVKKRVLVVAGSY